MDPKCHGDSEQILIKDAFHEGVYNYYAQVQADDNPYDLWVDTPLYESWLDGWLFAKKNDKNNF